MLSPEAHWVLLGSGWLWEVCKEDSQEVKQKWNVLQYVNIYRIDNDIDAHADITFHPKPNIRTE